MHSAARQPADTGSAQILRSMTHATRFVAAVAAELPALALCVPVQAQTPEIDALRARAEAGDAGAQNDLGFMYASGEGVPEDEDVRWYVWHKRWADGAAGVEQWT